MDDKKRLYVALLTLGHGWHTTLEILGAAGFKRTPKYLALLEELIAGDLVQKRMMAYRADGQERAEFALSRTIADEVSNAHAYSEILAALPVLLRYVFENEATYKTDHVLRLAEVLTDCYAALDGANAVFSDGSRYQGGTR